MEIEVGTEISGTFHRLKVGANYKTTYHVSYGLSSAAKVAAFRKALNSLYIENSRLIVH